MKEGQLVYHSSKGLAVLLATYPDARDSLTKWARIRLRDGLIVKSKTDYIREALAEDFPVAAKVWDHTGQMWYALHARDTYSLQLDRPGMESKVALVQDLSIHAPGFKVGDRVRLVNGRKPIIIHRLARKGCVYFEYESAGKPDPRYLKGPRSAEDFVLFDEDTTTTNHEEEESIMAQLFTWKDADGVEKFGEVVGRNSDGMNVMEIKGSGGAVVVVDPQTITKVLPYSVGIRFEELIGSKVYNYWSNKEDGLKVGDVILMKNKDDGDYKVARVHAVDTASERANKWLQGFVLQGRALSGPK